MALVSTPGNLCSVSLRMPSKVFHLYVTNRCNLDKVPIDILYVGPSKKKRQEFQRGITCKKEAYMPPLSLRVTPNCALFWSCMYLCRQD